MLNQQPSDGLVIVIHCRCVAVVVYPKTIMVVTAIEIGKGFKGGVINRKTVS